jgi:DNA-binding PadR family transcriptional regulator
MRSHHVGSLSPEFVLLGLLSRGPAHGYELHQRLDTDLSQVWHLSQSQIYNILNRLEAHGFIHGTLQEQEKLPAKRLFRLTDAGRRHFEEWLYKPSRSSLRVIRVEFTTRLYFAFSIDPQLAHDLIDAQIDETQEGLQRLEKMRSGLPPDQVFNQLGLDLRIRQLNSIQEWLASCHTVLASSSMGRSRA